MTEADRLPTRSGAQADVRGERGEFVAVIGPRGAGTSALVNALGGGRPMPGTGPSADTTALFARLAASVAAGAVVVDELDAVDPASRMARVRELDARTASGATVIAALHDLEVAGFADLVVLVRDGRILAAGVPAAMLAPDHLVRHYPLPCATGRSRPASRIA